MQKFYLPLAIALLAITNLFGRQIILTDPVGIGYVDKKYYGSRNDDIYAKNNYDGDWYFITHLPFNTANGTLSMLTGDSVLLVGKNDTLLYYSIKSNKLTATTGKNILLSFCARPITKIIFESGSSGCFNYSKDELVYEKDMDGDFEVSGTNAFGSSHGNNLKGYEEVLDGSLVADFVKNLPATSGQLPSVQMLGFTRADYSKCKNDILNFKKSAEGDKGHDVWGNNFWISKDNADYPRLLKLVDSIPFLTPQMLNSNLTDPDEIITNGHNWIGVQLVNSAGETLNISNGSYNNNSLRFPWQIYLHGFLMCKNDIAITNFFNAAYPSLIGSQGQADILEIIAKALYYKTPGN